METNVRQCKTHLGSAVKVLLNDTSARVVLVALYSHVMPHIKLSRREWVFILVPSALILFIWLDPIFAHSTHPLSVLFNPLARSRENNRLLSCQSNLKQLGLGIRQYVRDNDNTYPLNTGPTQNWVSLTMPYTKSTDIIRCPSDLFLYDTSQSGVSLAGMMTPSYWLNANLNDARGGGLSKKTIDRPARTFLLGDWNASTAKSPFTLNEKGWSGKASYSSRHLFGANYAFTDGHVKWFSNDSIAAFQDKAPCCTLHS